MTGLLASYLRPYRWPLLLVVALLLVQSLANLYLPELYADIINNGVARGDTEYILQTGAVMLAVMVVLGIVSIVAVYWAAKVSMGFGRDLRGSIFRSVETFSQVEVNRFGSASLITLNTNDVPRRGSASSYPERRERLACRAAALPPVHVGEALA